jgi:CubicO group peptidase (beta-lactamase class C family)/D-alanyl-D-alanine dipeptidase
MRPLVSLFCLLVSAPVFAQAPAKYSDAIRAIEAMVERERLDAGIPGISIALVEDQTVLWSKGFGHADLAKTKAAALNTVYRVGSVSKLFTDIAVMQLVEEGKIDIDAPVTKYLPDFRPDNPFGKAITLRQLMSHRSGLVREPPVGNYFDDKPPSLEKTIASLNGVPLVYEPEKRIKYSNSGVATVGLVVEKVDGRPFAKAVRERVLAPLGMTASDFEPTEGVRKNLADGLMWTYHGREFRAPTFELGMSPAACMYSTVTDLARFMTAVFAGGKTATGRVLKPESLASMLTPQFVPAGAKQGFGLGFYLSDLDGHRRAGHGGAMYGFVTELAFLPEDKLGVVVIANKDIADWVTYRLADSALQHLLAAKAGKPLPVVEQPKPVSRDMARKLAGKYGEGSGHALIEAQGKLFHFGPGSDYVAEVWKLGDGLVEHGVHGSGTRFTCDGTSLTWPANKGNSFPRVKEAEGPPPEPPAEFRGLIGEYGWDHDTLFIFERDRQLYGLIEWFFLYPLEAETKDVYKFPNAGLYHGEKLVFKRDASGKALEVEAARVRFPRRPIDGEDGQTFRIKPLKPVDELRQVAMAATPPQETGDFRKADLVELTGLDPTIKIDLRYASDNNFMGTPLYPKSAKAYMQRPAAEALAGVNKVLAAKGYGLWVFDGYRPWTVTKMFWEATPEKMRTFVADPSKGSRHNRGCAVDLTLYELKSGKPVEMVSGFDEFSDRAYPNYWGGTSRQRWHRELLRRAMEDGGFTVYEAEWWHFDYKDWRSYRIGNQSFEELGR